jgi:hypothetical protein
MSDNTTLNTGSGGDTIATDDIGGGVKVQRVKVGSGADGSYTDASAASPLPTSVPEQTATGSLTATNQAATLTPVGCAFAGVQITGTWAGTVQFEGSIDGTNFFALGAFPPGSLLAPVTSATANGQWFLPCGGLNKVRVRCSAFTSGTIAVTVQGSGGAVVPLPLPVTVVGGGDGTIQGLDAHDAAITGNPVLGGGYASAAAPSNVSADGDAVRAWFLRNGAQCMNVTAAGALVGGDATNGLDVDVTRVIPGTGATNLGKAEDAAAADGDTGVAMLAVRRDTASSGVSTDGDYACLSATSNGSLRVDNSGQTQPVGGVAAHDAAVSGNPVLVGCEARTAVGTAVNSGDAVRALADVYGKQVVLVGALHEDYGASASVNFTGTAAADLVAAAGSGIKIVITQIAVTNAHASQGAKVTIRDKTTTTNKKVIYAAPAGGGASIGDGQGVLMISGANVAIEAICSASADVDVSVTYYTIKN